MMNKKLFTLGEDLYGAIFITGEQDIEVWETAYTSFKEHVETGDPSSLDEVYRILELNKIKMDFSTASTFEELKEEEEKLAVLADDQLKAVPVKLFLSVCRDVRTGQIL